MNLQVIPEGKEKLRTGPVSADDATLLGAVLVEQGKIKRSDIQRIVTHASKKNLRFGEAAIRLKLISRSDLEHAMAAQFDYPFLAAGEGGYPKELVAAFKPFSPKGQALRTLRIQLLRQWQGRSRGSLSFVGAEYRQGVSYLAANMAIVYSQLGHHTLLVDADMLNGRQHELFRLQNNVGLSAILAGRASASAVIKPLPLFRALSVLPSGARPPDAAELVSRPSFAALTAELHEGYEVVIYDTPPLSASSAAGAVASACSSSVLVVRKNRTAVADGETLANYLQESGAKIAGTVISDF